METRPFTLFDNDTGEVWFEGNVTKSEAEGFEELLEEYRNGPNGTLELCTYMEYVKQQIKEREGE